ncbi:hypothetical protein T492DRAFT_1102140, partial [Pavlovales sp. CCMP2436]
GVVQDHVEAARLYGLAAKQGFATAQYELGRRYTLGQGVVQDHVEAARLYGLAAKQGFATAQYELDRRYTLDHVEAARLYWLAAEQDHEDAQYSILEAGERTHEISSAPALGNEIWALGKRRLFAFCTNISQRANSVLPQTQLKAQQPLVPAYWKHAEPLTWTLYKMTTPSCRQCKVVHGQWLWLPWRRKDLDVEDLGLLVKDAYVDGGNMCQQASQVLIGTSNTGCACGIANEFDKVRIYRIENHPMWQHFCFHEKQIEVELAGPADPPLELFESHDWLRRLEERNGLSVLASTRYLLHGTSASSLPDIVQYGLRTKFTGTKSGGALYGTGLYFTISACKAWQYIDRGVVGGKTHGPAIILVCRVALGKTELLATAPSVTSNFSKVGHHSKMAKHNHTTRPGVLIKQWQIHDEFIVFDETQVYPEFVLEIGE